jgi:hypothetical protein
MYNHYTNRGNRRVKPVTCWVTYPYFNSVKEKGDFGLPKVLPSTTALLHPFKSHNSKLIPDMLFHMVQN